MRMGIGVAELHLSTISQYLISKLINQERDRSLYQNMEVITKKKMLKDLKVVASED